LSIELKFYFYVYRGLRSNQKPAGCWTLLQGIKVSFTLTLSQVFAKSGQARRKPAGCWTHLARQRSFLYTNTILNIYKKRSGKKKDAEKRYLNVN
jgi:hypothetical protein